MNTPDPILALRELQAFRVATMRMQLRINNAAQALVRRSLGWRKDLPEKERNAIKRRAQAMFKEVERGHEPEGMAPEVLAFVMDAQVARLPFDRQRGLTDKEMRRLAKALPVWVWCEGVVGVGALGLAIIVGECGDLSGYSKPGKVWKRLGLARKDAYAMTTKTGEIAYAIPRRRRSAMWTIGDAFIKCTGSPYRAVYLKRKDYEREEHPELTKMHTHKRAQRYMEKRFLRHLWQAWRNGHDGEEHGTPGVDPKGV